MRKAIIIAATVIVSVLLGLGAMAQEIKVGSLMAFTGPLKEFGPSINNGAVLAARQINAAGLHMKLITADTETSPIAGVSAARKLVNIDKVVAIIGPLSSGVTVAVAESVTCPNNILMISPSATSPMISTLPADKGKDLLFRTAASDAFQGVVAGKLCATYNKTASVIYVNNPYGQGLAQNFKKSFEKYGGKVLAMVPVDNKPQPSYAAELRKALAGNPDILCAYTYPEQAKIYLKEAIELFHFKRFLFCDGTKSETLLKAIGAKNLQGQMGTVGASAKGKANQLFLTDYKREFGKAPSGPFISNAYDAGAVIGLAAYAAKVKGLPITSISIRDNLRAVANPPGQAVYPGEFKKAFSLLKEGKKINYEGAAGSVDFDKNGDVMTPIMIWKYWNGKIVNVKLVTSLSQKL